jgi:porphobilinogen synthase
LTGETRLHVSDLVFPLFVDENLNVSTPIQAMPGQSSHPPAEIGRPAAVAFGAGIRAFLLFGVPRTKDAEGSAARHPENVVTKALTILRREFPEAVLITDVCLCAYTNHGHCGVLSANGEIMNDATLPLLGQMAVTHAQAGADLIAPSDMMDGRIQAIRADLDRSGFSHLPIMAYSAKYASSFYGPFREAAHSSPQAGDRKGYQMDPGNRREALIEMQLDHDEGADILMVKPALPYLDIIREARNRFSCPIAAYQVSGEYSMIRAAAANGWIDEQAAILESLVAIRRAGADLIITYFAPEVAPWITP